MDWGGGGCLCILTQGEASFMHLKMCCLGFFCCFFFSSIKVKLVNQDLMSSIQSCLRCDWVGLKQKWLSSY